MDQLQLDDLPLYIYLRPALDLHVATYLNSGILAKCHVRALVDGQCRFVSEHFEQTAAMRAAHPSRTGVLEIGGIALGAFVGFDQALFLFSG